MLAVALLACASALGSPPKVERLEIVDRAIEFHGGDAFESSTKRFRICSKSGCFAVRSRIDGGRFEHTVEQPERGREVRITNDSVERWQDGEPVEVAGKDEQRWRDWVSQRVYFAFLPYALNDPSVYKQDLGLVDGEHGPLHLVKVSFEPGTSTSASSEFLYWFEPDSGRMVQYAYSFDGGVRLRRSFNERRVGGILVADSENWGVDGKGMSIDPLADPAYVERELEHISTVTLEDVEIAPLD